MNVGEELQVSQIVSEATLTRKPDFLLGVELKAFLKDDNGSKANELAFTLLEQTFQGTIPNPQILSYLKYAIKSELITCSSVFSALGAFKKTVSPAVLSCLLLIVRNLLASLVSHKCDDNVQQLSKSLITLMVWSLHALNWIIQQCTEQPELWSHMHQNVTLIVGLLQVACHENKVNCLLYIASIAETEAWAELNEQFNQLVQVIQHMQRNDQLRNQITQSLQDIKSALLDHPGTKLKRLLSKDMDDTFDASQRVVLEIFLSHQHSPLFVSSTAEICHKLLDDLRCCLGLSLDETIEALLQVGMKAISHTGASWGRWATLMYIRIPQMLRLMAAPSLLQVLVRYLHQNEVHINQNQQLKLCMEGFLESLISHGCITADEAAALPIKITQHESFNRLVQANQHFEKLLRDNAKIIQSFEKQQVDPALLIYIAGATGKLTNLAFALLNASQNDATKDTIFGTAFLLLWKMVHIYGKAAVFKDINASNFHIVTWFESQFQEDRLSLTAISNETSVTLADVEMVLGKAADPPKKGNDHLGAPFTVMKAAPKMLELLLRAKAAGGGVDEEKMAAILMTLRDSSRAGFMTAYARLLQLAICGETSIQKMAQYYLIVYQQSKYKSKQTQTLLTSNCEDMLRDVFSVDAEFAFTPESIKNKFDELNSTQLKPKEEVGQILNEILMSQSVTQAELTHLAWLVRSTGIELFTRLLSNFIYQQRRRDLTELACNIAIGLSAIDWIGIPLALIWYQLPEVLSSVECSTTAEPFARFLATQLHFVNILEAHKTQLTMAPGTAAAQMFHQVAGNERRHFHGRNSELRRMLNADSSSDWKLVSQVRKVVTDGGLESLQALKQQGNESTDQFTRCFHALGRTLFLAMSEAGQSVPVDFCLSLLDHIIKKGVNVANQQTGHTESIIQYFPWPLLNQLLQIAGIESRIGAILIASIDPQIPMLRTKIATMIALAEKRQVKA